MNTQENVTFRGVIVGKPSREIEKVTGAVFVLQKVQILEGPLKGDTISAERTLINSKGDEKLPLGEGESCIVYLQRLQDKNDPTKLKTFFTIGEDMGTDAEIIEDKLDTFFNNITVNAGTAQEA